MRAINPAAVPDLPEDALSWVRSTRRKNSMFHAHAFGHPTCGASIYFDRFNCTESDDLNELKYYGVCPRCFKLGGN